MVKDHHLQPRCFPPLFLNFRWFNIKGTPAQHSVIQKEMDELLAKGVIEPSSGEAGFTPTYLLFLSILVAYIPSLTLSDLIAICTHLPFRWLLSDKYKFLFNKDIIFSIDLKDSYIDIPIIKHHHHFLWFVWHHQTYQWKFLPFGLVTTFSLHSLNPYCLYARICILLFTWMISWSLIVPSLWEDSSAVLCSLLVLLGLHINFSKSDLHLMKQFSFFGPVLEYIGHVCLSTF